MENYEIDWELSPPLAGNLGGADWPQEAVTHAIDCQTTNFNKGHVYNVLAVLTVGATDPIVTFAESPTFVIT